MVSLSGSLIISLYSMPGLSLSSSTKDVEVNFQGKRPKRVSDPLNEVVRARLCGNHHETQNSKDCSLSSGSEHEGESLISFTDMLCVFMEDEQGICLDGDDESVSHTDSEDPNSALLLESLVCCRNAADLGLLRHVTQAVEMAKTSVEFGNGNESESEDKSNLLQSVLNQLKMMGYNAGICKSRPHHIKAFHAGYYEYIDVIMERRKVKKEERIFVDIDFRAQFEVARPTMEYSGLLQLLPEIFVGKAEKLHQIISMMCKAAKRSLKKKTMHIPPWRKYHYMRSKWLGSYKRTTTTTTTTTSVSAAATATAAATTATTLAAAATTFAATATATTSTTTTFDMTNEWQLPTDNSSLRPAKNGKVSGLAMAFIQPAIAQ